MAQEVYGVIGLGRFGTAVATTLLEGGCRVIVLDNEKERVEALASLTDEAFVIPQITKESLTEAGLTECSTVIVGIGKSLESSLLAALNAIELKVPRVIAKANSEDHARILKMIGAEVVFPEVDMGTRLAKSLKNHMSLDFLSLCDNFSIVKVDIPRSLIGKSVLEADLRRRFGINIIAMIDKDAVESSITPDMVFREGVRLVVAGKDKAISSFIAS